ncbi:hypothetical protein Plhal304r1_c066g0154291 [Plasmopara halstedii]
MNAYDCYFERDEEGLPVEARFPLAGSDKTSGKRAVFCICSYCVMETSKAVTSRNLS